MKRKQIENIFIKITIVVKEHSQKKIKKYLLGKLANV